MSKVGVILPSRGLIFSKTAEEILKVVKGIDHKFFFSHRLPIPDCFELPLQEALNDKAITDILIIEEDMILPPKVLKSALELNEDVVVCDYPIVKNKIGSVVEDSNGKVIYSGTGFMLIKRNVFDKLSKPYFRADILWKTKQEGTQLAFTAVKNETNKSYGTHDITFCMKLTINNINISKLDIQLGQRKLITLGKVGSNNGAHFIEKWRKTPKNAGLKSLLGDSESKNITHVLIDTRDVEL